MIDWDVIDYTISDTQTYPVMYIYYIILHYIYIYIFIYTLTKKLQEKKGGEGAVET